MIKVLWAGRDSLYLFTKRLGPGRFIWSVTRGGRVHVIPAELSMLMEGKALTGGIRSGRNDLTYRYSLL